MKLLLNLFGFTFGAHFNCAGAGKNKNTAQLHKPEVDKQFAQQFNAALKIYCLSGKNHEIGLVQF